MTHPEETAPFAGERARAAIHTITRNGDEPGLMIAVFEQLAESWAGGAAFSGCHLVEAGISRRLVALKVAVLRRDEEGRLAAVLDRDPAAYELMTEAGDRSVTRLIMRRAA